MFFISLKLTLFEKSNVFLNFALLVFFVNLLENRIEEKSHGFFLKKYRFIFLGEVLSNAILIWLVIVLKNGQ